MSKVLLLVFLALLSSCSRCSRTEKTWVSTVEKKVEAIPELDGKVHFKMTPLEEGVLARSGDHVVYTQDLVEDPYLKDLNQQKESLLEKKAKEDKAEINLRLGLIESETFRRKLLLLDKKIKDLALSFEADKLDMTIQEYVSMYIFEKTKIAISETEINQYLKEREVPEGSDPQEWAKEEILKKNQEKSINYVLEKYILGMPIDVSLTPPQFPMEIKYEWVPHWGPQNSEVQVFIFSDIRSSADQNLLKELPRLKEKYSNLFVGYRPLFSIQNPFQKLSVLMNFCVWTIEPEKYWDYLIASLGDHKDKMEKKLYQVGEQLGLKMPEIKQCVFEQRHMDVVNYHSEFNQYLGIQGGPLVYVSGELFSGAFTVKDIEAAIDRKLSLPTAGVW